MRRPLELAVLTAALVACGGAVGYPRGPRGVAAAPAPRGDSCAAASARARAEALRAEGKLEKTVGALRDAARSCPDAAAAGWALLETTLSELRRDDEALALADAIDAAAVAPSEARAAAAAARAVAAAPPPDGGALLDAARAAAEKGDGAAARALYDRALAAIERAEHSVARASLAGDATGRGDAGDAGNATGANEATGVREGGADAQDGGDGAERASVQVSVDGKALRLGDVLLDLSRSPPPVVRAPAGTRIETFARAKPPGALAAVLWGARELRYSPDVAANAAGAPLPGVGPVALSADAAVLATAGDRHDIRVFDLPAFSSGRAIVTLRVAPRRLWLDAAGTRLLVDSNGEADGTSAWDTATGALKLRLPIQEGAPIGFDGKTIALQDGEIVNVWDVGRRNKVRATHVDAGSGPLVASADGRLVASRVASVFDTATGALLFAAGEDHATAAPVFTSDARVLLVPRAHATVAVWDVPGRRAAALVRFAGPAGPAGVAGPAPDAAAAVADDAVELYGDPARARALVACTVGTRAVPFEACAERMLAPGLLVRLFGGAT